MQINPDKKQILGPSEPLYPTVAQNPKNKALAQADGLESSFTPYIGKAREVPAETVDIEQIRKELESGLYDKPEMIRGAAEKILCFGI